MSTDFSLIYLAIRDPLPGTISVEPKSSWLWRVRPEPWMSSHVSMDVRENPQETHGFLITQPGYDLHSHGIDGP